MRNSRKINSILLFKLRYIGDVLMTTPAIRLLRKSYPDAHITMVVNKGTEDVIRYNPHINRILTVDRNSVKNAPLFKRISQNLDFLKSLREQHYDISIDFASGDRAAYLSLLAGVPYRIGFSSGEGWRRVILNRIIDIPNNIHTVMRYLLILDEALGLRTEDTAMELYTDKADDDHITELLKKNNLEEKKIVVIHTGGRYWFKRWQADKWASLIDLIQFELGLSVVITGTENERKDIGDTISRLKTPACSIAGQTTVLQLASLLKKAKLFIGNDSGPMHIAAASGTPVIALHGPTDPSVWGPWGKGHTVISSHVSCSPCKVTDCVVEKGKCMEQISVEEVWQTVNRDSAYLFSSDSACK